VSAASTPGHLRLRAGHASFQVETDGHGGVEVSSPLTTGDARARVHVPDQAFTYAPRALNRHGLIAGGGRPGNSALLTRTR